MNAVSRILIKLGNSKGGDLVALQALINKQTLQAICESKKVTYAYIAQESNGDESKICRWANPSDLLRPTIRQAKEIAKCLHVPFAGLYMNPSDVPLHKIPKMKNMRVLPDGLMTDDSSLNIALVDLISARELLMKTNDELGEPTSTYNLNMIATDGDVQAWSDEIRRIFDLSLETQFKCTSMRQFYLYLRRQVENNGIFIHCFSNVELEIARGVAIYDEVMPIIGLNEEDRPPAKSFSIIHELVHIFKRQSSLCNDMLNSFSVMKEEIFCNAVAGEVLVPQNAIEIFLRKWKVDTVFSISDIQEISARFSVSKEVIIRRLLDIGRIHRDAYDIYADEFRHLVAQDREAQKIARQEGHIIGIPRHMEREAIDKNSSSLCDALYNGYGEELYSKQDIARYLGIDQKHVRKFLWEVSSWRR